MRSLYNADSTADARAPAARYAREFGQDVFLTLLAGQLSVRGLPV
jgi:hypothetical protein